MNLVGFIFLYTLSNDENSIQILNSSLIFGVFLPIVFFVILRQKGKIVNDDATEKSERTTPYLFGVVLTILAIFYLNYFGDFTNAEKLWIVYFISTLIIIPINYFWKISAHALGVSIPLALFINYNSNLAIVFVLFLSIVFWARLQLKVHTHAQLIFGALLGSITTILIFNLF